MRRFWDVAALVVAGFLVGAGLAMILVQPPHLQPRPERVVLVRVL